MGSFLKSFFISATLSWFVYGSGMALAATVVAKSSGVKVKSEPRGGKTLTKLKKGQSLETTERKGMYWKVKLPSGETGFVSVLKVKRKSGTSKGLAKAIRAAAKSGRSNAEDGANVRSRSAVMGVRGLDESEETAYAGSVKPNLRMVYAMEDRIVSNRSVSRIEKSVMKEVEWLYKKRQEN